MSVRHVLTFADGSFTSIDLSHVVALDAYTKVVPQDAGRRRRKVVDVTIHFTSGATLECEGLTMRVGNGLLAAWCSADAAVEGGVA